MSLLEEVDDLRRDRLEGAEEACGRSRVRSMVTGVSGVCQLSIQDLLAQ